MDQSVVMLHTFRKALLENMSTEKSGLTKRFWLGVVLVAAAWGQPLGFRPPWEAPFATAQMMRQRSSAPVLPAVDLGIANVRQETTTWCWAAVAQQIIQATVGPARTPPQCALVAAAQGMDANVCCVGYPGCLRAGTWSQISGLIAQYGGRASYYAMPADPMTLYGTLAAGRPVLLRVRTGLPYDHVVVVRGMSFAPSRQGMVPVLHINDPVNHFTRPVPFSQIAPLWLDALVVL